MAPAHAIRDRGDHAVMALVAFTGCYSLNGQQHAFGFDAPCTAQFMAIARSKPNPRWCQARNLLWTGFNCGVDKSGSL
jgi:hypothetical protein